MQALVLSHRIRYASFTWAGSRRSWSPKNKKFSQGWRCTSVKDWTQYITTAKRSPRSLSFSVGNSDHAADLSFIKASLMGSVLEDNGTVRRKKTHKLSLSPEFPRNKISHTEREPLGFNYNELSEICWTATECLMVWTLQHQNRFQLDFINKKQELTGVCKLETMHKNTDTQTQVWVCGTEATAGKHIYAILDPKLLNNSNINVWK